jgi:hypothetical protein
MMMALVDVPIVAGHFNGLVANGRPGKTITIEVIGTKDEVDIERNNTPTINRSKNFIVLSVDCQCDIFQNTSNITAITVKSMNKLYCC